MDPDPNPGDPKTCGSGTLLQKCKLGLIVALLWSSKDGKSSGQSAVCVADIDYLDIGVSLCEPEAGAHSSPEDAEANKENKVFCTVLLG
jgi:hypothetical protein